MERAPDPIREAMDWALFWTDTVTSLTPAQAARVIIRFAHYLERQPLQAEYHYPQRGNKQTRDL